MYHSRACTECEKALSQPQKALDDDELPETSPNIFPLYCTSSGKKSTACREGLVYRGPGLCDRRGKPEAQ